MQNRIETSGYFEHPGHTWHPLTEKCHAFGTLDLGDSRVYLYEPGQVDEVIAELTALRAEMTDGFASAELRGGTL